MNVEPKKHTAGRYALILLGLSVLAGCQTQGTIYQTTPWPLKSHTGTIIETAHYRINTPRKDKDFYDAAVDLAEGQYERFYDEIEIQPKEKMNVYVFSDVKQWIAFTKTKFGEPHARIYMRIRNGGYAEGNIAAFYNVGRYATLTIMAHELFHLYIHSATGNEPVPAWVNEGLACYFEAHEWDVDKLVFTPEKNLFRQQNLAEAFSKGKMIPIKELLSTHAGEVSKSNQPKVLTYYAQLWSLIRYLEDPRSGVYHTNFKKMLKELGTRQMVVKARGFMTTVPASENVSFGEAVFRQYITNDLSRFEEEFYAYTSQLIGMK